jgi:hypothetical protein
MEIPDISSPKILCLYLTIKAVVLGGLYQRYDQPLISFYLN